jgi:hypothetical protein
MKALKQCIVLGGVAVSLLIGACASSPEPFDYQQSNELKPGPGLLTGEEGVYTIYGPPPPVEEEQPAPAEEDPAKPDAP